MKKQAINFELNGEPVEVFTEASGSLLHLLRGQLGLLGTKEGCGAGECGACTVLLDNQPVNACLVPAAKIEGKQVQTIESLSTSNTVHPLQESFVKKGAVQCGFCTPGMVLSAYALLKANPDPTPGEVKEAISGNLCRCSGYKQVEEAVLDAAEKKDQASSED